MIETDNMENRLSLCLCLCWARFHWTLLSLPEIWVKIVDARAQYVVNGGEIVKENVWKFEKLKKKTQIEAGISPFSDPRYVQ